MSEYGDNPETTPNGDTCPRCGAKEIDWDEHPLYECGGAGKQYDSSMCDYAARLRRERDKYKQAYEDEKQFRKDVCEMLGNTEHERDKLQDENEELGEILHTRLGNALGHLQMIANSTEHEWAKEVAMKALEQATDIYPNGINTRIKHPQTPETTRAGKKDNQ